MNGSVFFEELLEFRMGRPLAVVLQNEHIRNLAARVVVERQFVVAVVECRVACNSVRTQITLDVMPIQVSASDCHHRSGKFLLLHLGKTADVAIDGATVIPERVTDQKNALWLNYNKSLI